MFFAVATEDITLLRREFYDNESIDACCFAVFDDLLLAIATERVVVSHEDNRHLESPGSCFLDHIQAHWDIDLVFQCNLRNGPGPDWRAIQL
jgi:hypothetical protein